MGDASLNAGETCGGVEESSEELSGAASSESPEAEEKKRDQMITRTLSWWRNKCLGKCLFACLM